VYVPKGLDAAGLERLQLDMEQRLRAAFEAARAVWVGWLASPNNTIA
jgi:hypothetical protein